MGSTRPHLHARPFATQCEAGADGEQAAKEFDRYQAVRRRRQFPTRDQFDVWNATAASYPNSSIPDLIRSQGLRSPTAVALSDDRSTLTYEALDARVRRVASALHQRRGVEEAIFEPRLEPGLPPDQLGALESANIRLLYAYKNNLSGVTSFIFVLGLDGQVWEVR